MRTKASVVDQLSHGIHPTIMQALIVFSSLLVAAQAGLVDPSRPVVIGSYSFVDPSGVRGRNDWVTNSNGYRERNTVPADVPLTRPYNVASPDYAFGTSYAGPIRALHTESQDILGNGRFAFSNALGAREESGPFGKAVTGSYSFVNPNGVLQRTTYVADDAGFRSETQTLPGGVADAPERAATQAEFAAILAGAEAHV